MKRAPQVEAKQLEQVAMALHRPGISRAEILAGLSEAVVTTGLAQRAEFIPFDRRLVDLDSAHEPATLVAVRRPDLTGPSQIEGLLACDGVGEQDVVKIELLAAHAGSALATVKRLTDLEAREESVRRVAERLQDSLLPTLPDLANTSMAVQYRAAAREARVGGDFYDVFPLPDGRALVVVGDVMGKGVEAAGRTSMITQTLRALALQGLALDELLERADEHVRFQDPEIMATVWCGFYEPDTGELTFASLGHPPALLMRANGEPVRLTMEGLPLGLRDLAEAPPECRDRQLQPRDLLVLYTDGVVEASGDYVAGQDELLAAIERRRNEPLGALLDEALEDLLAEAGHTDDAVMLLLRRR